MKRALILVLPLLAVGLVACGDDDDSPDVTTGVTTAEDLSPDETVPDLTMPDLSIPDISLPDLSIPDFSVPDLSDISVPDISEIEDQLRTALGATGLSDEQIDCLIDAAADMRGESVDAESLPQFFEQCDVSASDLLPGG